MADFYTTFSGNSSYRSHATITQVSQSTAGNTSQVSGVLKIEKLSGSGFWTTNSGNTGSISGDISVSANGWAPYDFRDYSSKTIGSGTSTVTHNTDGTKTASGSYAANDSAGGNFGSANGSWSLALTTIVATPGVPTSAACSYVSDTQISVSWARPTVTNNAPNTSQVRTAINGATAVELSAISATLSVTITTAANQKIVASVRETNGTGSSAWSTAANAVYTTPAPPTDVVAAKDASLNIVLTWAPHVAFTEHQHIVEHGTVSGGTTTWDGSVLATVAAGTSTYTHTSPDAADVHIYRVFAKNTATGTLESSKLESNSVQLLAAPNKPTLPALSSFQDKAKDFVVPWSHNPVDTTPQTAYELGYSTNGGGVWSTTGKITSATSSKTFAASTYAADVALTVRVRTWGEATSGGAEGTGASDWSDLATVTFKTRPVVTITAPADGGTLTRSALTVELGFSQAESATFVNATIEVYNDTPTLLETLVSTTRASTLMGTSVADGATYTVKVTLIDSNGLVSDEVDSTFDVSYTLPVAAVVTATYLEDSGIGQIGITIADPGAGEVAATLVTITRVIGGASEAVITDYPKAASLTILDMTPTISGTNSYTVTTTSADGATAGTPVDMVTAEGEWGFMSTGEGYSEIIQFGGNFTFNISPTVDSALIKTAGRSRPVALYATTGGLEVGGSCLVAEGFGSTADEIEAFLKISGKGCYRDPSGRRVFGQITGNISRENSVIGSFSYNVTETS
jgi:hypothetical protein